MSIKVTPSDQLDVDLTDAQEGDLLLLQLEKGLRLILTVRISHSTPYLYLDHKYTPIALLEHVKQEVLNVLRQDPRGAYKWYEQSGYKMPFYQALCAHSTSSVAVRKRAVGQVPEVSLYDDFRGNVSYQLKKWTAPSAVLTIREATREDGLIEEATIAATIATL